MDQVTGILQPQMLGFQDNMIDDDKLEKFRRARMSRRLKMNSKRIGNISTKGAFTNRAALMKARGQPSQVNGLLDRQIVGFEGNMIDVDKVEKFRRARMARRLKLNSKRLRNISMSATNTQLGTSQQNTQDRQIVGFEDVQGWLDV
ncbi:hypothetical protein LXL04_017502 [Taraxacum kok-saghyz]